ncbi:hypothetical protein MACK_002515 [Theileria orientalis]|uniref:Uncharacterized protein n=1 Tax=Theileria orientalis TaxID=68886 RepID=A0A976MDE7_THEOR|nr:hypothetical protein MACK_002515 [Theileria orientalis]
MPLISRRASSSGGYYKNPEIPKPPDLSKTNDNSKSFTCELDSDNEFNSKVADTHQRSPTAQPISVVDSGVDVEPRSKRGPAPIAVTQAVLNAGSGPVPRKSVQSAMPVPQTSAGPAQVVKSVAQPASNSVPIDTDADSDLEVVTPSSRQSTPQVVKSTAQTPSKSVPIDSDADSDFEVVTPRSRQSTPQAASSQTQDSAPRPRAPQPRAVPVESQPVVAPTSARMPEQPQPQQTAVPRAPLPRAVPVESQPVSAPTPARVPEHPQPQEPAKTSHLRFFSLELRQKITNDAYVYVWDAKNYAHLFVPRYPFTINQVTDNGDLAWKYQGGKYPTEVRIEFDQNDNPSLELEFPVDGMFPESHVFSLELRQKITNDAYVYVWDAKNYAHLFVPRYPFTINQVTDNGDLAWKYQGGKYPTEVRIEFDQNDNPSLEIDFPDNELEQQPSAGPAQAVVSQPQQAAAPVESQPVVAPTSARMPEQPQPQQTAVPRAPLPRAVPVESQPVSAPTPARVPEHPQPQEPAPRRSSGPANLISVDINYFGSTNEVDYFFYERENVHKFLCKEGYLIYEIKRGPKPKWRYQQGDYPNRVLILRDENNSPMIRILSPNDQDPDEPTGLPQPKFISVDINYFGSTNEVDYFFYERENVHKFLCKEGYLIYEIKRGPKPKWRYQQGDYPNRVLILRDENNSPMIRILSPNDQDPDEPTGLPQPKLISVDINYFGSTNEVDYFFYERENVHKFLCKEGYLIYEIKRGPKPKWRYQQGDYPNRVLILRDENNSPMIRILSPNDQDPDEPTGLPQPKFISVDINYFGSTNEVDYFFYERENVHKFLCKEGYLIYEIKRGPKPKWRYQQGDYPNRVLILRDENNSPMIRILSPNDQDPDEPGYEIPPFASVEPQPSLRPVEPVPSYESGLITLNVDYLQSTDTVDYTYDSENFVHIFKSRGSLLFDKVLQNGKVIWKPKNNRYGNRMVIKILADGSQKAKMHYPDEVSPDEKVQPFLSQAPSIPDQVTQVKEEPFVGISSPVSTGVPIELEPGIEGVPFVRIPSLVPTVVPSDLQPGVEAEPLVRVPSPPPKRMTMDFDSDVEEAEITELTPTGEPIGVVPSQVQPSDVSFTLESGDEVSVSVSAAEKPIIPKVSPVVQPVDERLEEYVYEPEPGVTPDYSPKAPIDLNIRSSSSTKAYDYNKNRSKKTKIYTAFAGFGFASVKYGGSCCSSEKTIWEAKDDNHYGRKVELIEYWYENMYEINIYLYDATKRKFYRTFAKPWTQVDLSKLNPVSMNIASHKETYSHTTTTEDRFKVLVSKQPFVFDNLSQMAHPIVSRKAVWSTTNSDEYVAVVFRDGLGCSKIKNVTLHLINGDYRHLKMIDGIWVKKSSYLELDLNHKQSTFEYTYSKINDTHTYEGNFDFLFTKVQIIKGSGCCSSETVIWERRDNKAFANKVVFTSYDYKHMHDVIIYFHDGTKKLFIQNQKNLWNEINMSKKYEECLNIDDLKDTYFCTFKSNGQSGTYEAKEPFVFSSLVEFKRSRIGTKKVWEARNPNKYATKVVIDGPNRCSYTKNATLTLVNGSSLSLTRTGSLGCTPSFCCFLTLGLFNCCAKTWEQEQDEVFTKNVAPTHDSIMASDQTSTVSEHTTIVPEQMTFAPEQTTSFDFDDDDVGELIEF